MGESLIVPESTDRSDRYDALLPQIKSLIENENDLIANLANTAAALKEMFGFFWVGFYLVKKNQLILGPFQGPLACTRIAYGRGVCGKAWVENRTIYIPDVNLFPGHIACNSASKSEIVVPIRNHAGVVKGLLDIDSDYLNDFTAADIKKLEQLACLLKLE